MTYTAITPPTTGTTISTSTFGIPVVNAITEMWQGQAAGDMAYYTSATTMARLAGGTANANMYMRMNNSGSAPAWDYLNVISYRQGGDATDWNVPGTTNYTPTKSFMQSGVIEVTWSGYTADATITFPTAFAGKPQMLFSYCHVSGYPFAEPITIRTLNSSPPTTTTCPIRLTSGNSSNATVYITWQAIGDRP